MNMNNTCERNSGIEFLRIISMLMIIFYHAFKHTFVQGGDGL